MYRPEGLKNPHAGTLPFTREVHIKYDEWEAGAVLEGLKKAAWRCIPREQSYEYTKWNYAASARDSDMNMHTVISPDPKGWLVFIPEEE